MRKRFGAVEALRDASLHLRAGEILGIIGPNGAGKTTLLECIAGLLAPDDGTVRTDDGRIWSASARRTLLLYLPDGIAPWADQEVHWVLDFASAVYGAHADWRATLSAPLALDELRGRRMGQLSKGQRKRVLLAIALAAPQPVVLMDEPFDGLDLRQTREAIALFRRVASTHRSLLVSIHSMSDAARVSDRVVLLNDGHTVAEGTPEELRALARVPTSDLEEIFLALT